MIIPSTKLKKTLIGNFIDETYNKRNLTVGDELLATNVVIHISNSDNINGIEDWKLYANSFLTGFSDIVISVKDTIGQGDKMVVRWTCRGVHTGEFHGIIPTDKQATWTGIAIYHFVGNKIDEIWVWNDIWSMMQQLGVIHFK